MIIKHRIKLTYSRIKGITSSSLRALKYHKEIKETGWIVEKRKNLTLELLGLQRINQDSDEIRELKAKISILNEMYELFR